MPFVPIPADAFTTSNNKLYTRDDKTTLFFGPAQSVVPFPGPARNTIFNFMPVWARRNLLSSMFLTNYLVLLTT